MEERPVIFIPFGATGDLMRIKVLPALFELFRANKLPKKFRVIGFSHRNIDTQGFRAHVREQVETHTGKKISEETIAPFLSLFEFIRGEFDEVGAYEELKKKVAEAEKEWGEAANRLFYLAIAPRFYEVVAGALKQAGLTVQPGKETWARVIIEKPFGLDTRSADKLETYLGKIFTEEQIYRIDHYLAKDALQKLPSVDAKKVEHISIRLLEDIGVEKRGASYDILGALRDVGQNHVLEILALLTEDKPTARDAKSIRSARAHALQALPVLSEKDIAEHTWRAQYDGYRSIAGVAPDSQIETYFKIFMMLTAPRWSGVPIVLEAGKRLGEPHKEILVTFRDGKNVSIRLESSTHYTDEYMKLLLDSIAGDQTRFISGEEVAAMWRFTDPILSTWQAGNPPLHTYTPDTKDVVEQSKVVENA